MTDFIQSRHAVVLTRLRSVVSKMRPQTFFATFVLVIVAFVGRPADAQLFVEEHVIVDQFVGPRPLVGSGVLHHACIGPGCGGCFDPRCIAAPFFGDRYYHRGVRVLPPVWRHLPYGYPIPFGYGGVTTTITPYGDTAYVPIFPIFPQAPLPLANRPAHIANAAPAVPNRVAPQPPLQQPARGPFEGVDEIRRRVSVLKPSTPAGRTRADRSISLGDTAFSEQVYARALSKYRDAIARAPDYAEGHFRLAHAYIATRRFNLALDSALIALELSGTSRRPGFSLQEMYRGNKFARETHDEQLLDASLREPDDGGLEFLIGFTLHYGGNPLKAREHFRRSATLEGPHQPYLRHFLPVVPIAEPNADDKDLGN